MHLHMEYSYETEEEEINHEDIKTFVLLSGVSFLWIFRLEGKQIRRQFFCVCLISTTKLSFDMGVVLDVRGNSFGPSLIDDAFFN